MQLVQMPAAVRAKEHAGRLLHRREAVGYCYSDGRRVAVRADVEVRSAPLVECGDVHVGVGSFRFNLRARDAAALDMCTTLRRAVLPYSPVAGVVASLTREWHSPPPCHDRWRLGVGLC